MRIWCIKIGIVLTLHLNPKRDDRPDRKANAVEAHEGDEQAHSD